MKIPKALGFCGCLGLMLGIVGGIQLPATAADKISFWYSALEFSVDINDLEQNLAIDLETPIVEIEDNAFTEVYKEVNLINSPPTPKTQWQSLLTQEIKLDRVTVSRLLNSYLGTRILHSIGEIIRVSPQQNGFYALRSALILAPDASGRFTLLDVIRQFPAETINIDAQVIFKSDRCKKDSCIITSKKTLNLPVGTNVYQGLFTIEYQEEELRRSLSFKIPADVKPTIGNTVIVNVPDGTLKPVNRD